MLRRSAPKRPTLFLPFMADLTSPSRRRLLPKLAGGNPAFCSGY
jgi:hypothetical protein